MLTRSKLIIFVVMAVVAFLAALAIGYLILFGGGDGPGPTVVPPVKTTTLEIWGLFDDSDVYEPMFAAYKKTNPNVNLIYRKYIWDDYESTLVNKLAAGQGPDIFMIHNSWLGKHKNKLALAPAKTPYPFISTVFKQREGIWAYPLFIDNLALFYNQDLLAQEGFTNPPRDWNQFTEYSKALTRFSSTGTLLRSGASLGTNSARINRATDILMLLMLQSGIEPYNKEGKVSWEDDNEALKRAREALRFYTDFANPSKNFYSWNEEQDYSIDAFWQGKTAMMFNYAYNIEVIRQKSPYLNFATATIPGSSKPVTIGNYWGLAVSKYSKNVQQAWNFLNFFASSEQYHAYITLTKRLPAKDELLKEAGQDPLLKPFVEQSGFMVSPYQPDEKKVQEIFDEMILTVNKGERTLDQALALARERLSLLIQ